MDDMAVDGSAVVDAASSEASANPDARPIVDMSRDLQMVTEMGWPIHWKSLSSGTTANLYAVWTDGPSDVFVVGEGGIILHSIDGGQSWHQQTSGTTVDLLAVWGRNTTNVYAVGSNTILHNVDGTNWLPPSQNPPIQATYTSVWGSGVNDVYIAAGTLMHSADNGSSWQAITNSGVSSGLAFVWGAGQGDVYAAGLSNVVHGDGTMFSVASSFTTETIGGLWGSLNTVYVSGRDTIWKTADGMNTWSPVATMPPFSDIQGLWGLSPNDFFVTIGGLVEHTLDGGASWTIEYCDQTLCPMRGIFGSAPDNVYAVGSNGAIFKRY